MLELKNSLKVILNKVQKDSIHNSFNGMVRFLNFWNCNLFCDDAKKYSFITNYLNPYFESVYQVTDFKDKKVDLSLYVYSDVNIYNEIFFIVSSYRQYKCIQIHYDQEADYFNIDDMHIFIYKKWNHIVINNQGTIYIFLNDSHPNAQYIPMRILRDTTYHAMLVQGFLECHAASVQINNKGVLICGEGGSGKTTLAFSLVDNKNAAFLSNDKTFLKYENASYKMYGWPYSINVYINTANVIKSFSFLLKDQLEHYQHKDWKQYNKGKRTISINELSENIGIDIVRESNLDYIIFPNRNVKSLTGKIRRIGKEEAIERLISFYRFNSFIDWIKLNPYNDKLKKISDLELKSKYNSFIFKILQYVPAYEIGAYDSQQEAVKLIEKIIEL